MMSSEKAEIGSTGPAVPLHLDPRALDPPPIPQHHKVRARIGVTKGMKDDNHKRPSAPAVLNGTRNPPRSRNAKSPKCSLNLVGGSEKRNICPTDGMRASLGLMGGDRHEVVASVVSTLVDVRGLTTLREMPLS